VTIRPGTQERRAPPAGMRARSALSVHAEGRSHNYLSSCALTFTVLIVLSGNWGTPVASQATVEPRFTSPEAYTPKHLAEKILTSKAALEGERKQVTVLFADLKDSMESLADRDPEDARKLLDPVLERMIEAVHPTEAP
jgi:hypothetical protein